MRAAVITAPGKLELQEIPAPTPGPGQVRIRSAFCGICATDLSILGGTERTHYPMVLGHEWSGVVDAVGPGVDAKLVGTRCVADNAWAPGDEVGFEHGGAYGEYFLTQARLVLPLPTTLTLRRGALVEPLAVCVRGVRRLRLTDRSAALIYGDGVIGLLLLLLLKQEGVREITVVGGRKVRLEKARAMGAAHVVNYHEASGKGSAGLVAHIRAVTGRKDFPNQLEASASDTALEAAWVLGALEGHILLIGDYPETRVVVPWQTWLHHELEVTASNASAGAWPDAVRLGGLLGAELDPLVTHTVPLEKVHQGMDLMRGRDSGAIRVLVDWGVGP